MNESAYQVMRSYRNNEIQGAYDKFPDVFCMGF